jgi:hypothetical protein
MRRVIDQSGANNRSGRGQDAARVLSLRVLEVFHFSAEAPVNPLLRKLEVPAGGYGCDAHQVETNGQRALLDE